MSRIELVTKLFRGIPCLPDPHGSTPLGIILMRLLRSSFSRALWQYNRRLFLLANARYLEPLGMLNIWLGYVGARGTNIAPRWDTAASVVPVAV